MKRVLPNWLGHSNQQTDETTRQSPLFNINEPFVPYQPEPSSSYVTASSSQEYNGVEICDPQRFINEEDTNVQAASSTSTNSTINYHHQQTATDNNSQQSNDVSNQQVIAIKTEIKEEVVDSSILNVASSSDTGTASTLTTPVLSSTTSTTIPPLSSTTPTTAPILSSTTPSTTPASSTTTAIKTEVKSENADSSTPARQSCSFGIKCYRLDMRNNFVNSFNIT